ncbi:MAG: hypothetical protein V2B20_15010 [Pseudomonadota bacterium]
MDNSIPIELQMDKTIKSKPPYHNKLIWVKPSLLQLDFALTELKDAPSADAPFPAGNSS